jgi:hypothetical protein
MFGMDYYHQTKITSERTKLFLAGAVEFIEGSAGEMRVAP